jgi:hypothetical protein
MLFVKIVVFIDAIEGTVNLTLSRELKMMATACFVIRPSPSQP